MRRGQAVSLFIIAGILLLLAFAVWQMLGAKESRRSFEREAAPTIEQVPTEARPVFEFIQDCIRTVSKDGFVRMGDRGGYLDTSTFDVDPLKPTESEALQLHISSDLQIPYWWYMSGPNNCEKRGNCNFQAQRPPLHKGTGSNSIEEQIEGYVEENIDFCLRGFAPFEERGLDVEVRDSPKAQVSVGTEDVTVILNMPTRIKSPSATHDYDTFLVDFYDFKFKDIYTLASNIAELQANYSFLEKSAMNLISLYSGVDAPLPPIGATEFDIGPGKFWVKRSVTENIKNNILAPYVSMMQVYGTANYRPISVPESGPISQSKSTVYNKGMLIPASMARTFNDLTANFQYLPIWDIYTDLNCDGEICQSQSGETDVVIPFGINRYQFAYDVSYPVLVSIGQPAAFNGRGYQLMFAMEANLRNNQPISNGFQFIVPEPTPEILPSDPFASIDQRTSGEVTINVFEGASVLSNIPIPVKEGVTVTFQCADKRLQLGYVEDGTMKVRLPRCLNGILEAKLLKGVPNIAKINTMTDSDQEVNITIWKSRELNVSFKKIPLRRYTEMRTNDYGTQLKLIWQLDNETPRLDLKDYEEATIILKRKQDYPGQRPTSIIASVYGNHQTKTDFCSGEPKQDTATNVEFVPGFYEGQIMVMAYKDITIPDEERPRDFRVVAQFEPPSGSEMGNRYHMAFMTMGASEVLPINDLMGGSDETDHIDGVSFNCTTPMVKSSMDINLTILPSQVYPNDRVEFAGYTFDLEDVEMVGNTVFTGHSIAGAQKTSRAKPRASYIEDMQAMEIPGALIPAFQKEVEPIFTKGGVFRTI